MRTTAPARKRYGERVGARLYNLHDNAYIDWPEGQWVWRHRKGGGSRPHVYAPARKGDLALIAAGMLDAEPSELRDWTEDNGRLKPSLLFMPHQLAVGNVKVAARLDVSARPGFSLRTTRELTDAWERVALPVPETSRVLYPDWLFGITQGRGEPSLFGMEADCDTETTASVVAPQSLLRKYLGYHAYMRARLHLEQFGIGNFRVLTVTTGGPVKVENIWKAAACVCDGSGVGRFLVTNFAAINAHGFFDAPWWNAAGEVVRMRV